jgi:hypothetical protein
MELDNVQQSLADCWPGIEQFRVPSAWALGRKTCTRA